jgi:hypothetical protein
MWRSTLAINAKAEANMHSSLKINLEGAAVTGASNGAGRGPSYVAFKIPFALLEVAWGTGGHINVDATLGIQLSDWFHRKAHDAVDKGKRSRRLLQVLVRRRCR